MNAFFAIDCATVLDTQIRGESSLQIAAYSPEHGLFRASKRISAKRTGALPDIFDDISLDCEAASPSALKFVREFSRTKRRAGIAESYDAFEQASLIAQTVLKNGGHIEDSRSLSNRLRLSLDAIDAGRPPVSVRLKFMYLLARDEGYPVREDFYRKLPPPQKELFSTLVKTPSEELRELESRARDMLEKLCRWIYAETDIAE